MFLTKVQQKLKQPTGIDLSLEINAATASGLSLADFLVVVLEALQKVPHVLVGGLALAEYAKPRYTQDLDFVIVGHDMDQMIKLLEGQGFKVVENLPYQKPQRDIVKFEYQGRECDLIFYGSKDFTSRLIARAKPATVMGKPVKVASAEDLVITKLASMRWKDKADIMAIRTKDDRLDVSYIRDRLWDLGISDRIQFLKLPVED